MACTEMLTAQAARERFLGDVRFHWADRVSEILGGEFVTDRKPPDLFPSQFQALAYRYITDLPSGLSEREAQFFGGIFRTLRDRGRVFDLIQMVVQDIQHRSIESVLIDVEQRFGLTVEIVLAQLTADEWRALLSDGKTFVDLAGAHLALHVADEMRPRAGHWQHGQMSHRFQLHLILRDMALRPDFYGGTSDFLALYKRMGDEAFCERLDWSMTGLRSGRDLFFILFDSPENNGSSPGFYSEYAQEYWPELAQFFTF